MKKSLIFFVISIISCNNLFSQKSELFIEFTVEKAEFIEEEPVFIRYKAVNTGDIDLTIFYNCSIQTDISEMICLVKDSIKIIEYSGNCGLCLGENKLILKPGDSISTYENNYYINGYNLNYGYGYIKSDSDSFREYLPEGNYSLNFTAKINDKLNVSSNRINFIIKKPE